MATTQHPTDPLTTLAPTTFALGVEPGGSGPVVAVTGDLDASSSPRLRSVLADLVERPGTGPVIVDVAGVTFLDSTGLGVLVGAQKRAGQAGNELVLQAPTHPVCRVLEVTGLADTFTIR